MNYKKNNNSPYKINEKANSLFVKNHNASNEKMNPKLKQGNTFFMQKYSSPFAKLILISFFN